MGRASTPAKQEWPINPFPSQERLPKKPPFLLSPRSSLPLLFGRDRQSRHPQDDTKPHFLREQREPPARDQIKVQGDGRGGLQFSKNIIYTAEKRPAAIHHGLAAAWLWEGS